MTIAMSAVAAVKLSDGGATLGCGGLGSFFDGVFDSFRGSLLLEFVSTQLDEDSGAEKKVVAYARRASGGRDEAKYECRFAVPSDFGAIGGVLVQNGLRKEIFLRDIAVGGAGDGVAVITSNSWVQPKSDLSEKRIFFSNKSYLPSNTPIGLRRLRSKELELKRGDGHGERRSTERNYDYATYNDLGEPDSSHELARPVLGGNEDFPYPRRCRTGRPPSQNDPSSESRVASFYVPRDEEFSQVKSLTFNGTTFTSVLHAVIPAIRSALVDVNLGFQNFAAIDQLYNQGYMLPEQLNAPLNGFCSLLRLLCNSIQSGVDGVLFFEKPTLIERNSFSWLRDEEFARQTLAGVNPCAMELVRELPLLSKLCPSIYGPPESAITEETIERGIEGRMSAREAMQSKRLFILDYHDLFLPYVHKVREQQGTTLYGSRTLFFLNDNGTLSPIAIELTRPPSEEKPQWKEVFTPSSESTGNWLWRFAKAHVCAHDSGHHELVSHWLRTHCSVEPYIIAANRQLSAMHPIYRLLSPHFRYTIEINALARQCLINAGGIIESSFSPRKYSMELSSATYGRLWRLDMEGLPADLLRRGMAEEDPQAEHGQRLVIPDYPFAADGLLVWSAITDWVSSYVAHYYPEPSAVVGDNELQAFWTEVRTRGHADKKDEPWWPVLDTIADLSGLLTTIIWVASAHHAAVNFAQYQYGGYFPNHPTIARTPMPTEFDASGNFADWPEAALMRCFPSQMEAMVVIAVLDVLSSHSPDEEYLGEAPQAAWAEEAAVKAAFERFSGRMKEIEGIIDGRNRDARLRNRSGVGVLPYELLKPFSGPGVTGCGIRNSTSI